MFSRPGLWEIVIIVILIIVIFGGRKIPELGRSLGKGITNFRSAMKSKKDGAEDEESAGGEKEGSGDAKESEK